MKNRDWSWMQRRWYEFRTGDSIYLRYVISFFQFIVVTYTLYIVGTPLEVIFQSMLLYTMIFLLVYIPVATVAGHIHRKRQLAKETVIAIEQNPITAHSSMVGMEAWMSVMGRLGMEVPEEYRKMYEYWKRLDAELGWKP